MKPVFPPCLSGPVLQPAAATMRRVARRARRAGGHFADCFKLKGISKNAGDYTPR